ncbi:hypothetical protein ACHAXT_001351 [Thalassiosira profunda]
MKLLSLLSAAALATASQAFAPNHKGAVSTQLRAEIGETGVAFENVAREWRCKYSPGPSGGPGDSESLKACQSLLDEYLPKLKALPGAKVTRQVCGGCLDFKVSITQPLEEHGAWADADYNPLESEFMEKLKGIDGTSLHETQEITFEAL